MKLCEFIALHEDEQLDLLYLQGSFIGKRRLGSLYVLLYQLDEFYIKIYYIEYRKTIHHIFCFNTTTFLDPYINQIEISDLVSFQN